MNDKAEIAAVTVIVLGIALIAGLVVNENRKGEAQVLGEKFTNTPTPAPASDDPFVIPTLDSTVIPTVVPTTAAPSPSVTPSSTPTTAATATATTAARPATTAAYDIAISCQGTITYEGGTAQPAGAKEVRGSVTAGRKLSYEFAFDRDQNGKQVSNETKTCVIKTTRTRTGSEPNLRVKQACDGSGTYESAPPAKSTNVESNVWRPAQLLDGYTHRMSSKPGQISERTTCVVEVVAV